MWNVEIEGAHFQLQIWWMNRLGNVCHLRSTWEAIDGRRVNVDWNNTKFRIELKIRGARSPHNNIQHYLISAFGITEVRHFLNSGSHGTIIWKTIQIVTGFHVLSTDIVSSQTKTIVKRNEILCKFDAYYRTWIHTWVQRYIYGYVGPVMRIRIKLRLYSRNLPVTHTQRMRVVNA